MIIGVGVDIVVVARIEDTLFKGRNRFLVRVFTPAEQAYCFSHALPCEHLAARFAAKEAVLKVLGTGWSNGIKWIDVEVCRRRSGQPYIVLTSRALEIATAQGIVTWHLSLTHSAGNAVAVVVAEGNSTEIRP